jgi:hypothetical protein
MKVSNSLRAIFMAITAVHIIALPSKDSLYVIDNFLTDERQIQAFLDVPRPVQTGQVSFNGFVTVPPSFANRILNAVAAHVTGDGESRESCSLPKEHRRAFISDQQTILTRTITQGETPLHQDRHWDSKRSLVKDSVGFVFLNDNTQAKFVHGSRSIPVTKGSLVIFRGDVPHQTIVDDGQVYLAGPFRISPNLDHVGNRGDDDDDVNETEISEEDVDNDNDDVSANLCH